MHQMGDGHVLFSDHLQKIVAMCDANFNEIRTYGNDVIKYPSGLAVNTESRTLYVADCEDNCVHKFNVDTGKVLGKIGSEGRSDGNFRTPTDVTLTKKGHVIVADFDNNRIQMFDANDRFMRRLVGFGYEDGEVINPCGVTMDPDELLIVSSYQKLQVFDKNGDLIKRIGSEEDGLDAPCGITVISSRPRQLAVANHRANNVKIFNY
ncbi:probable peptidyl-alpha-hydroxyglycine alpha-amidating lyase pgal-1 [Antedon mediterranea]|uniref:probable peptidyl-alpha-hydroxyglycine alpha-amidating lyase pgal-1 n=1 Tax=Antedon mediterranea TaxID=105859 RepID=UPI003AF90DE7